MEASFGRPRILFVDHAAVLGGAELCLIDVARAWKDTSRVVLLEDGPLVRRLEEEGIPVEVIPGDGLRGLTRKSRFGMGMRVFGDAFRLAREVASMARAYDIIYANSPKALWVARWAGWQAGKPVVWHLHDIIHRSHFSPWQRQALKFLGRMADLVIANSDASARAFGGKAKVIYNGIDVQRFSPGVFPAFEIGVPLVGLFGRLSPWKGQHVFLEALSRLEGVHGVVVGEALFGERDYAKSLSVLAQTLGIEDRVQLVGFEEDVRPWMGACDIVVHTSVAPEPFGRVIAEAMLLGKPVIASRGGGVEEIVEHGVTGLMVPSGDAEALARAIRHLLDHPDERKALAERARERALERFGAERMIGDIATALKGIR